MPEQPLPFAECRRLLGPDASVIDAELAGVREKIIDLAELVVAVYSDFKADVVDFDAAEIRAAGHWGIVKLTGFDIEEADIDEILSSEAYGEGSIETVTASPDGDDADFDGGRRE